MKNRILAILCALALFVVPVALAGPGVQGDPCSNPMASRVTVPVAVSTTGTTLLMAAIATTANQQGMAIDLCGGVLDATSGTSPTAEILCGTQTTNPCDTNNTGASILTGGAMLLVAGTPLPLGGSPLTQGACPQGYQLCITAGGTSPVIHGWVVGAYQ